MLKAHEIQMCPNEIPINYVFFPDQTTGRELQGRWTARSMGGRLELRKSSSSGEAEAPLLMVISQQ